MKKFIIATCLLALSPTLFASDFFVRMPPKKFINTDGSIVVVTMDYKSNETEKQKLKDTSSLNTTWTEEEVQHYKTKNNRPIFFYRFYYRVDGDNKVHKPNNASKAAFDAVCDWVAEKARRFPYDDGDGSYNKDQKYELYKYNGETYNQDSLDSPNDERSTTVCVKQYAYTFDESIQRMKAKSERWIYLGSFKKRGSPNDDQIAQPSLLIIKDVISYQR